MLWVVVDVIFIFSKKTVTKHIVYLYKHSNRIHFSHTTTLSLNVLDFLDLYRYLTNVFL